MPQRQQVIQFLDDVRVTHSAALGGSPPRILAFVGTTSKPGTPLTVAVRPLVRVSAGATAERVDVKLRGAMPRALTSGERVTAILTNLKKFKGYQVKTAELTMARAEDDLLTSDGTTTTLRGAFVFTVHPSPNTKVFFERVPFDDVEAQASEVRHAILGLGPGANLSPRFLWRHGLEDGQLRLYYGDGHLNKTAANFAKNRILTLAVVDLATGSGYALEGQGRPLVEANDHPAHREVVEGFASGQWGEPSSIVEVVCERFHPLRADG